MKLSELTEEQLEERAIKQAVMAAAIAAGLLGSPAGDAPEKAVAARAATKGGAGMADQPTKDKGYQVTRSKVDHAARADKEFEKRVDVEPHHNMLAHAITKRYNIDYDLALDIVKLAHKHEQETFPKANDILAVIGVESTFNPDAKSKLRKDPALGLMQVRPGIWNLDPAEIRDPEENIRVGADILSKYFKRFRDKRTALMAYNAGPDGKETSDYAPVYADKVERERLRLARETGLHL